MEFFIALPAILLHIVAYVCGATTLLLLGGY
jgi:hypothetical protein